MTWTLVAHTKLLPSGHDGGTTSPIDCTGANLLVVAVVDAALVTASFSDSQSNDYANFSSGDNDGRSVNLRLLQCSNPTVTSSMTFTVSGANTYSTLIVQAWKGNGGVDQNQHVPD